MDDKDDDKKRVLTPPSEWAEGMIQTASAEAAEISEDTDWLEDDDFEVPPESERSREGGPSEEADPLKNAETSADNGTSARKEPFVKNAPTEEASAISNADTLLTDQSEVLTEQTHGRSKLPWVVATAGFVVAVGMGGLWLDTQETANAEITELKNTIRSIKGSENKLSSQDSNLVEYQALQRQITELQRQNGELTRENETLNNRETKRAQRGIVESTKSQLAKNIPAGVSDTPAVSSEKEEKSQASTAPPNQVGGVWFVNLESHKVRAVAQERIELLRAKVRGTNLSIESANVNSQTYYRIRAAGFASNVDATAASKWLTQTLSAGPFWIGKNSQTISQAPTARSAPIKRKVANQPRSTASKSTEKRTAAKQPVQLKSLPKRNNWFAFVDTYDTGQRADEVMSALNDQGLDAKVVIELRSGKLSYHVQIVGIESESAGNAIVFQLWADEFGNARLRKTAN